MSRGPRTRARPGGSARCTSTTPSVAAFRASAGGVGNSIGIRLLAPRVVRVRPRPGALVGVAEPRIGHARLAVPWILDPQEAGAGARVVVAGQDDEVAAAALLADA